MCVCLQLCLHVYLCVREREVERERESGREIGREREIQNGCQYFPYLADTTDHWEGKGGKRLKEQVRDWGCE